MNFVAEFSRWRLSRWISLENIHKPFGEEAFFYMEYSNDTIPDFDIDYIKHQNENNIIGKFIEKMQQYDMTDERYRRALYKGLALLLSEGDK